MEGRSFANARIGEMTMKQGQIGMTLDVAGYETAMEGEDMRAVVLTLDQGQTVPWHYHSTINDSFVCLKGPMVVVETRAPGNTYVLNAGERCVVPPKTAHHVHGLNGGPCQFMVLQGIGVYDNVRVGRARGCPRWALGPRGREQDGAARWRSSGHPRGSSSWFKDGPDATDGQERI
jgi:quercetin dioxygenase-like cupin family protein